MWGRRGARAGPLWSKETRRGVRLDLHVNHGNIQMICWVLCCGRLPPRRSCAGLSPSLEPLKIRGGAGDSSWPRLWPRSDPALCPVLVQSAVATVSRNKVMIGAFLGVHRGDAELFKPHAAVWSLVPDTHSASVRSTRGTFFFLSKFLPEVPDSPARGLRVSERSQLSRVVPHPSPPP